MTNAESFEFEQELQDKLSELVDRAIAAEPPIVSLQQVAKATGSVARLEAERGLLTAELRDDVLRVMTHGMDPVTDQVDRLRQYLSLIVGPDMGCDGHIEVALTVTTVTQLAPQQRIA